MGYINRTVTGEVEVSEAQQNLIIKAELLHTHGGALRGADTRPGHRYVFINRYLAEAAFNLVAPDVQARIERESRTGCAAGMWDHRGNLVYLRLFGDPTEWEYPYLDIIRGKAQKTFETGHNNSLSIQYLAEEGDMLYGGGVYGQCGIYAVSAFKEVDDEAHGEAWDAACCRLIDERREGLIARMEVGGNIYFRSSDNASASDYEQVLTDHHAGATAN